MLKIPRNVLLGIGALDSENPANFTDSFELEDSPEEVTLESFSDVEWLTNALEPDQQRGPSENP